MKKIIYKKKDNSLGIITPSNGGYKLGIEILGKKDTPTGLPFWIIDEIDLPTEDIEFWDIDTTEPDGYGE